MPWEHSLCGGVGAGPKGRVSLSGQILANWPLLWDLLSSLAPAIGLVIHKTTDEKTTTKTGGHWPEVMQEICNQHWLEPDVPNPGHPT